MRDAVAAMTPSDLTDYSMGSLVMTPHAIAANGGVSTPERYQDAIEPGSDDITASSDGITAWRSNVTPSNNGSHGHSRSLTHSEGVIAPDDVALNRPLDRSNTLKSVASSHLHLSDNERWRQAYSFSSQLEPILSTLRRGNPVEPFILSDDGLLYIYVEEEGNSEMEVPRLVPPEGKIRKELVEDAVCDVKWLTKGKDQTAAAARGSSIVMWEKAVDILRGTYWWATMEDDVRAWV